MATITFGFRAFGSSVAAGILLTGLTFGLVLLGLVARYRPDIGLSRQSGGDTRRSSWPSGSRRSMRRLLGAQLVGGSAERLLLLWVMHSSPFYSRSRIGLGANGYGSLSLLHASGGGAFLIEVIITAVFVLWCSARRARTRACRWRASSSVFGLALVNIMAIAIDGASVNPARSFGPAIIVGGHALSQVWLFLIAPLVGAVLAAGVYLLFHPAGRMDGTGVRARGEPVTGVAMAR